MLDGVQYLADILNDSSEVSVPIFELMVPSSIPAPEAGVAALRALSPQDTHPNGKMQRGAYMAYAYHPASDRSARAIAHSIVDCLLGYNHARPGSKILAIEVGAPYALGPDPDLGWFSYAIDITATMEDE